MHFYEALKILMESNENIHIARKSWGTSGIKWVSKSEYKFAHDDTRTSLLFTTIIGGEEDTTLFYTNPDNMMADDWYVL